jgi:hypothetical protein
MPVLVSPGTQSTAFADPVPPDLTARRNHRKRETLLDSPTSKGDTMPKDMHQKAAEHHEQAAKAHRIAAEQHGSSDHATAKQQSSQAADKSKAAHEQSTQANSKSQQQK